MPVAALVTATSVDAAPPIRISAANPVPACVTPERLMTFLEARNETLNPRYRDIARWYKYWGERFAIRWDYAFYQMAIETNYLKYRRGDGRRGDVHEKQNNFAGIGATGGGVAGDRFPDIKTGVEAQFQHLIAYSGEHVANPVARRTRENQDEIIAKSRRLKRAVTFGDLARRWAADRHYAQSIDVVADQFRTSHCNKSVADNSAARVVPASSKTRLPFTKPSRLGGPELQRLAGPADDLPWAEAQAADQIPEQIPDRAQASASPGDPPRKKKLPVRTIWSRDGRADLPTDGANTKAAIEPPSRTTDKPQRGDNVQAVAPPLAAASDPIVPQPVPAAPTPPAALNPVAAVPAKDDLPVLPAFRIAPHDPEPSRLGGPVPQLLRPPEVAERAPEPRVRFKEVIGIGDAGATEAPPLHPCRIVTASYGGPKTLLVRTGLARETRLTALGILEGFEKSMFETYAKANGGGEIVGEYASKDEALADARANCPGG